MLLAAALVGRDTRRSVSLCRHGGDLSMPGGWAGRTGHRALLAAASTLVLALVDDAALASADPTLPDVPKLGTVLERRLANGLRVVIERDPRQPLVAVVVAYDVGQRDDPRGYRELAHLVEHLTFRGTRHLADGEMARRLDAAGAVWNAYTSADQTAYETLLPARHLPLALWLESERMGFAADAFAASTLEVEREVVRRESVERGAEGIGS